MSVAVALTCYTIGFGVVGGWALRRATWVESAPRLAVLTWQALSISVVVALLLTGLSVALPASGVTLDLAELIDACVMALASQYTTPGGAVLHVAGATVTAWVMIRILWCLITSTIRSHQARDHHLQALLLTAHPACGVHAMVVDHQLPVAYSVPGRSRRHPGTVVLTSAALQALDHDELDAVLAHEHAHLTGRHHAILMAADVLARALPWLPLFRWSSTEQARLLEMIADDAAAERGSRITVATALVQLAEGAVPSAALGAADVAAVVRVRRLVGPPHHLGPMTRAAIIAAVTAVAVLPLAIAVGPAVVAARMGYCPVPMAAPVTPDDDPADVHA